MKQKKLTYIEFGNRIKEILLTVEVEDKDLLLNKTDALILAHTNKAASPRKKESKVSAETLEKAALLHKMLTPELQTCQDINKRLGKEVFSPLTLSNLLKYIPAPVVKDQVIREVVSKKGLKQQKYYTAYALEFTENEQDQEDAE